MYVTAIIITELLVPTYLGTNVPILAPEDADFLEQLTLQPDKNVLCHLLERILSSLRTYSIISYFLEQLTLQPDMVTRTYSAISSL